MAQQTTRRRQDGNGPRHAREPQRTQGSQPRQARQRTQQAPANRAPARHARNPQPQRQSGGNKAILVVAIVAVVAIVVGIMLFLTQCTGKKDDAATQGNQAQSQQVVPVDQNATEANATATNATEATGNETAAGSASASSWELTLVNKTHPLPENWSIELAEVDDGKYVDARIADQFTQMIADCRAAGFDDVFVNQAYRSHEEQQEIWDQFVSDYVAQGYSEEEAEKLTGESVAIPGTSEHELGLAADICSIEFDETYNAPIQTWLRENGHKYGFIQRYPEGKESITGTKNENWHFRYVGVDAATKIYESGQVLEEYLGEA